MDPSPHTFGPQPATNVHSIHLREAEESGCSGSARNGSNFIAAMSKIAHLTLLPNWHVLCEIWSRKVISKPAPPSPSAQERV